MVRVAISKSKGELVIPISFVKSILLPQQLFVPKTVHVEKMRVTVKLMTCATQETVDQRTVLLFKPVQNVLISYQMLIAVMQVHIIRRSVLQK